MLKRSSAVKWINIFLLAIVSFGCNKEEVYYNIPIYGPKQIFYALSDQNALLTYNAADVRNRANQVAITGLAAAEKLLSIDFRPATGELYAISSASKIYIINIATGVAYPVSSIAFSPLLTGTSANLDFNPTTDQIRVITSSGQNLRINPESGAVISIDGSINNQNISGIAHSNSTAGASSTSLYQLDPVGKKLYKQEPINTGPLQAIGDVELNLGSGVSFDISPDNSNALAIGKVSDSTKLFTINLSNGKATLAGKFTIGTAIRSIAIPSNPVAYAVDKANNLLIFNPTIASTAVNKPIIGLQTGETIYGLDMRPQNGQIYALGSSGRLYTVNICTGELTQIGTRTFSTQLAGTSFGFDFDPFTDMIRVVSNTGQNLKINPNTASVTVDASITPATAQLSAAAFANNFRSNTGTTLYVVDDATDQLYSQVQETGALTAIGALKINVEGTNGFDIISSSGNIAYGIFTVGGKNSLYTVDLSTGAATPRLDLSGSVTAFTLGLRF